MSSPASPARHAVRRGTAADAAAIGRLLHDFNTEYDDPTPGPDKLAARIEQLIARRRHRGAARGRRARTVSRCSGSAAAIWSEALECYLAELYVAPAARGRGLGRALMNAAIELARAEGADYMDLGTGGERRCRACAVREPRLLQPRGQARRAGELLLRAGPVVSLDCAGRCRGCRPGTPWARSRSA